MIDETPSQPPPHEGEGTVFLQLRRQRGFTLVELWVSLLIIGTMAGITLVAFQRSTQTERLNAVRDELLQDIRTMQGYSTTGRPVVNEAGTPCPNPASCGGYGVYLKDNELSYTLFQDYSSPFRQLDPGSAAVETLEVKSFPAGIRIEQITYVKCGSYGGSCFTQTPPPPAEVGSVHLYAAPYSGSLTFTSGTDVSGQQVRVLLKDTQTNQTKEFTVDRLAGGFSQ